MRNERSIEKQQFLYEAVFGLKNVFLTSIKTEWDINKYEIGLSDGKRTLMLKVDFNDAWFAREENTDVA